MKKEEAAVAPFAGFVKAISFALKQFRLYSDTHPITQQAIATLSAEIDKFFVNKPKVMLGSMRKLLVVDGQIAGEKDAAANDVAKEFDRLGIEGVTFEKGIDLNEMSAFLHLMAMRNKTLEERGGFKKIFEVEQFKHVRLTSGKYELVGEGEQLLRKDELPGEGAQQAPEAESHPAPIEKTEAELEEGKSLGQIPKNPGGTGPVTSIADIIHRIRDGNAAEGQAQQGGSPAIALDCEKIVVQLEKSPQEIAMMAVEGAADPAALESTLRKVIHFLIEGLISFLAEQGKDITKALQKLAKELEKAVERSLGEGPERDRIKKKIPEIFEEAGDELRIQMMVQTAKNKPGDLKGLEKVAGKLFKDEDVRKRLKSSLVEEMKGVGVSAADLANVFDAVDQKEAKKKSKVTVDAEELEELKRKAELFDKGGGGGGELAEKVKKLEREKKVILDEKERVDTVIRNLAEGLLVVDKDGKVVLMNPAAEKLLGVKKQEKIGKKISEGLNEGQMLAMTKGNLKSSETGVEKNVEVMSLNDDTRKILQASTAVIENEDGQTVGMVSVLSDVTKQKEVEELKTKFVSNVSHELRTPLVAIQKSLALILGKEVGDINPEQQNFLNIAHRNIDRLSRLINDLLDVSKIEAGAMKIRPVSVKLGDMMSGVAGTLGTWAKDKKVSFALELADPEIQIEVDADRITQVLTNLAGNALKFTPENGKITFDAKPVFKHPKSGEDWIEIGIKDTGIGIEPEDQKKIFEKFVQVSLTQPQGVSSTGLGLTICKEIVELHGGTIWVESEVGKGSRFAFKIPVKFQSLAKV